MTRSMLNSDCEVAIIGAGPYGLAAAAHLKQANISVHIFGEAMSFWRRHMPKGMMLRSSLTASDIADPKGALSLRAYADRHAMQLTYPLPLEDFIRYGAWFQANAVPDLDPRKVARIESANDRFRMHLEDGSHVTADRVVIALGLANQEFRPAPFAGLANDLVSHTCEHDDLTRFRGKRVAVVGRGQSACESAAILNDAGAEVELISRGELHWLGYEAAGGVQPKNLMWHARKVMSSKSGVGPFPLNQVAEFPDFVRMFPPGIRDSFSSRCLRPAATGWLRQRFDGVTLRSGHEIIAARASDSRVSVQMDHGSSVVDHVLLATGYHIDCSKLGLFGDHMLENIKQVHGSPSLKAGFESSVPGLHFIGASAVKSYGPLMRFVAGSGYAAGHLAKAVSERRRRPRPAQSSHKHGHALDQRAGAPS
jgi:cation diffusion facilitator CzcD-associated flavoprotein CzcO